MLKYLAVAKSKQMPIEFHLYVFLDQDTELLHEFY